MGGMGIVNPASMSQCVFVGSVRVTSPLVEAIAAQEQDQKVDIFKVMEVKVSVRQSNHEHQVLQFKSVYDHLYLQLKRYADLAKEKVPLLSCLFCDWMIMAFPSTKAFSRMQNACIMARSRQIPLPNVTGHSIPFKRMVL